MTSFTDFAQNHDKLLSDVLEMQVEEEPLVPIEVDQILLMSLEQIKNEAEQLPPTQRALFDDIKKFAKDRETETGTCEPLDSLMSTLV